ncbi:hypothetical protein GCM10025734_24460 [Kitasatospora paranensis]
MVSPIPPAWYSSSAGTGPSVTGRQSRAASRVPSGIGIRTSVRVVRYGWEAVCGMGAPRGWWA